jgi:hypothetical protein
MKSIKPLSCDNTSISKGELEMLREKRRSDSGFAARESMGNIPKRKKPAPSSQLLCECEDEGLVVSTGCRVSRYRRHFYFYLEVNPLKKAITRTQSSCQTTFQLRVIVDGQVAGGGHGLWGNWSSGSAEDSSI